MSVVDELEHRAARQTARRSRDDIHQEVRSLGFMGTLTPEYQDSLTRDTHRVGYARGSRIRDPGSAPQPGVIVDGLVRAFVAAANGREATVSYAVCGDVIGIGASLVDGSPLGLQALEKTTIEYFDAHLFGEALDKEIVVTRLVAELLALSLERSSNAMRAIAFGRVRQRVAEHLILLADRNYDGSLVVQRTQQGLADAVGSVRDVVARTLAELSSEGIVTRSRGRVMVLDDAALHRDATPPC